MEDNKIQPGQTVAPTPPPGSEPPVPDTPEPVEQPAPEVPVETPAPAPEQHADADESQFDASPPEAVSGTPDTQVIAWTASEFIAHAKSFGWYAGLAVAAAIGAVLIYLLTKDPVSSGVIIVAAIFLGFYAGHKPRELEYRLDVDGLSIGQKHFGYHEFKSFSVLPEGAFSSIVFMPMKRFAVPTTIYYAPDDENKIVSLLGNYLPLEERGHDAVDRLMHRIHF